MPNMRQMTGENTLPRCNAARTFSQDGRAAGVTFKRLSSSTRYERGNLRDVKTVSRRGVLLNPGYDDTSLSSRSISVPLPSSSLRETVSEPPSPGRSPYAAQRYGRRKKISLCRIIPRDHISDFESVGGRVLWGGTGSDSGELYSRLGDDVSGELKHVVVIKELTFPCSRSSCEAFASCRGTYQSQRASHVGYEAISAANNREEYTDMRVPSSHVRRTFPGFKSRCKMLLSCCIPE